MSTFIFLLFFKFGGKILTRYDISIMSVYLMIRLTQYVTVED